MSEKGKQCSYVWIVTINMRHGPTRVLTTSYKETKQAKYHHFGSFFQTLTNSGRSLNWD